MVIKKKVLIAEDVKRISNLIARALERIDYKAIKSFDGVDTLKKAKKLKPDVIILDILMPKKDGLEVLREIKADSKLKNTPVIILSCRDQPHQINEGLEAGADEYFTKPVFTDDLIKKVVELS